MKNPRIAYVPFEVGTNKYVARMRENLSAFGNVQAFPGFKPLLRMQGLHSFNYYDAVVLNWSEGEILNPQTQRISAKRTIKVFGQALVFRLLSRRVIFVRHNVYAHATAPESRRAACRLMNGYEKLFHRVLTHSEAHVQGVRQYCPHPLYKADAVADQSAADLRLPSTYFVVFGQIAPYKKIKELMLATPAAVNLVVIGSALDKAYHTELAAIKRPNVFYRPGFISERVAQSVMVGAVAAIVANAEADMVVSASFFYAISFNTPVIAVETPFLKWLSCELPHQVVSTVPNLASLPYRMQNYVREPLPAAAWQRIHAQFGDAAVRDALQIALMLKPASPS